MRKFALFFMLALTASMVVVLSEPVFAQEADVPLDEEITGEDMTDEETTGEDSEETTGEDMTDEETTGEDSEETSDESSMEEETMESHIDSPLKQMSMGVDPHQIQCKEGYKLVFKASNWNPSCIKESSLQTLSSWGWVSNHDPSDDDLTKMIEDHMAKYPKETEMETETEMEESMTVDDDSSSVNSTSTDEPEPQSSTVELRESMDMGNQ